MQIDWFTFGAQIVNDIFVMDDLVADIYRCAIFLDGKNHHLDSPVNARTKTARAAKAQYHLMGLFIHAVLFRSHVLPRAYRK